MVRLGIDYECEASTWWESGGRDLWESVLDDPSDASVVLDQALAESVIARAAEIPGWNDGAQYAPHPLRLVELADDEIE